jgi:agmatine deiminase
MSYLNYVISNGVVLLPSFAGYVGTASQKRMDEETGALFARLFPDREIVRIEPLALNLEGAGLHCAVQQQPARNSVDTD